MVDTSAGLGRGPGSTVGPDAGWPLAGNERVFDGLRGAVARGEVRHAYVVSGPAGTGKGALAETLARSLECLDPPGPGLPCGACRSCRKIGRGVHPDVTVFDLERQATVSEKPGSKHTSLAIETVREISGTAALRPMEGHWRVVIVEDAETMQTVAQQALLKTLEEPPPFMVLLLLTDDPESLLPTVRSRCQAIELRPAAEATVLTALAAAGTDHETATTVAGLAGGRIGWAHRALADPGLLTRQRETVDGALQWMLADPYDRVVTAFRLGDGFAKRRGEVLATVRALLGLWRDALLVRLALPGWLTYGLAAETLRPVVEEWDVAAIQRASHAVLACLRDLEGNVRPRLALEAMVSQWPVR